MMNPGKEIVRKQIEAIHFGYVNKTKKKTMSLPCIFFVFCMFLIDLMNGPTLTRFLSLFLKYLLGLCTLVRSSYLLAFILMRMFEIEVFVKSRLVWPWIHLVVLYRMVYTILDWDQHQPAIHHVIHVLNGT